MFGFFKRKKKEKVQIDEDALKQASNIADKLNPVKPIENIQRTKVNNNIHNTYKFETEVVITFKNGEVIRGNINETEEDKLYNIIYSDLDITDLKNALNNLFRVQTEENKEQVEEYKEFVKNISLYMNFEDHFEWTTTGIYLKGIAYPLPKVILDGFVDAANNVSHFIALKFFCYWLFQNPNPSSIQDALRFVETNEVKITPKGQLVLYRRVVSKKPTGIQYVEFISTSYVKIKTQKKSPKNYYVYYEDEKYVLKSSKIHETTGFIGNLNDLYNELKEHKENIFTDHYSRTKVIKVGEVYKEDEENIDWDNTISCGRGLHVASRRYDYSGFGDVAVMVIVNPSKIRSVPIGSADIGKMRVSEMYVASVLEIDEKGQYIDEHLDIVDMDEKYFNISVAEMENNLKTLDTTKLNGILTFSSLVNISKNLKTESDKTIKAMEKRIKFV